MLRKLSTRKNAKRFDSATGKSKMKGYPGAEEAVVPLLQPSHSAISYCPRNWKTARLRGAVNQLERWPSHLLLTFFTGCLIMASLLLVFVVIPMGFCLRINSPRRCRAEGNLIEPYVPSIYFVKHENRSWSSLELCHIESLARKYLDFDVRLVNLVDKERNPTVFDESFCPDERLRLKLASRNANVQNVDVSVERFFKGSVLSGVARNLSDRTLEIAAGTYLLWNSPGVFLQPNTSCAFNHVRHFLCDTRKENCVPEKRTVVIPEIHLQAAGVPCQTFVGFIIREISRNGTTSRRGYTLKEALNTFCSKSHCSEVKTLNVETIICPAGNIIDCPNVYEEVTQRR